MGVWEGGWPGRAVSTLQSLLQTEALESFLWWTTNLQVPKSVGGTGGTYKDECWVVGVLEVTPPLFLLTWAAVAQLLGNGLICLAEPKPPTRFK
jgi:hypothetical protein